MRPGDDDIETIDGVKCEKDSPKAILAEVPVAKGKTIKVWVPKSLIHDDSEVYKAGTDGKLVVARWFAEREGLG